MVDAKFKASRYNHFVPSEDGKRLAFNAMSCGLAEIDEESFQVYEALASGDGEGVDREKHADLIENLQKGGFLVDAEFDELAAIRAAHYRARFGNRGFGLTIIPTLRCNFACDYCYEDSKIHSTPADNGGVMSDEVCDNIVKLCEQRIEPKGTFGVTWYGGEPLLAPEIIGKLTAQFQRICEEKEASYHAGIITNGYFLDEKSVEFLRGAGVSFAQVTIDGPREVHDRRRCLRGGGRTFDRIMENLLAIPEDSGLRIGLRINVDKRNEGEVASLIEYLHELGLHKRKNQSINLGQVHHYAGSCPDISTSCMNSAEFSEFMVRALRRALDFGFRLTVYPKAMLSSCGAVGVNAALIQPDGDVHNCWDTVGDRARRTGKLTSEGITPSPQYVRWMGWSPFRSECEECGVLTLCMGGCPYKSIRSRHFSDAAGTTCMWWRHNLAPMLGLMKVARERGLLPQASNVARSGKHGSMGEGSKDQ